MAMTGEVSGKCPECDNTALGMRIGSDWVRVVCHKCGWVRPVKKKAKITDRPIRDTAKPRDRKEGA